MTAADRPHHARAQMGALSTAPRARAPGPRQAGTDGLAWLARAVVICICALSGVRAANAQLNASYLEPFPPNETYRLAVFGGSLANSLAAGLKDQLKSEANVVILDQALSNAGLARNRPANLVNYIERKVATDKLQIAVILVGEIDRQSMRADRRRYRVGTDEWRRLYGERVDTIIKTLRAGNVAVYWVGLPITSSDARNEDMQMINAILRERSFRNATRYIDIWDGFTDLDGSYSRIGPDLSGDESRLRTRDGVGFTTKGAQKLASFVARDLRRDLAVAQSQRTVPLAGDLQDMERLRQRLESSRLASLASAGRYDGPDEVGPSDADDGPFGASRLTVRNYPADDGLIRLALPDENAPGQTRTVDLKLTRPALPSAVVAHLQRRSRKRTFSEGAQLTVPLENGQTIQWLLTPTQQWRTGPNRSVPVTQTPYYKVLVKGEELPPRAGRADDFRWPPAWRQSQTAPDQDGADAAPQPGADG